MARGFQPAAITGKVVKKSAALDIFDHGIPGVAALVEGDELVIVYGPNEYTLSFPVADHVVDFAINRETPDGGPDGIFTVDGQSLQHWTYSGSGFQSLTIAGPWVSPQRVDAQAQPGGPRLVTVLDSDGFLHPGLYQNKVYTPLPRIPAGNGVRDIATADFDGDGTLDYAVLRNLEFEIYDLGGRKLFATTATSGAEHLLVLEEPSGPRVALIRDDPSGPGSDVFVLGLGGTEPLFKLPSDRVAAASAGDVNRDGLDDLVLALESGSELLFLENTGMIGSTFALVPAFSKNVSPPSGAQATSILAHDLDWDGDADVVLAQSGKLSVLRSPSKKEGELRPLVARSIKGLELLSSSVLLVIANRPRAMSHATHLRFALWEGPAHGPLAPTPIDTQVVPITTSTWPVHAQLSFIPSSGPEDKKYLLEVRMLSSTHRQSYPATLLEVSIPPPSTDSRSSRGFKVPGSTPVPFLPPFTAQQVPPTPWI